MDQTLFGFYWKHSINKLEIIMQHLSIFTTSHLDISSRTRYLCKHLTRAVCIHEHCKYCNYFGIIIPFFFTQIWAIISGSKWCKAPVTRKCSCHLNTSLLCKMWQVISKVSNNLQYFLNCILMKRELIVEQNVTFLCTTALLCNSELSLITFA